MFCNNCGLRGHVFRDCSDAILSCGVILIRSRSQPDLPLSLPFHLDDVEMLMVRRRESMTYTDFIRGKYDDENEAYIRNLLENMTKAEQTRLRTMTFDMLWERLWGANDRHGNDYQISKLKHAKPLVTAILKETTHSFYAEPEWGFPKGRRIRCETDIICGEREFGEETNIHKRYYKLVDNAVFTETFHGTNGVPYEHRYALALLVKPVNIHRPFTTMQSREISAIGWRTMTECRELTRPHYTGRAELLDSLSKFIQNVEIVRKRFSTESNGHQEADTG